MFKICLLLGRVVDWAYRWFGRYRFFEIAGGVVVALVFLPVIFLVYLFIIPVGLLRRLYRRRVLSPEEKCAGLLFFVWLGASVASPWLPYRPRGCRLSARTLKVLRRSGLVSGWPLTLTPTGLLHARCILNRMRLTCDYGQSFLMLQVLVNLWRHGPQTQLGLQVYDSWVLQSLKQKGWIADMPSGRYAILAHGEAEVKGLLGLFENVVR